jgi:hypothetical protein
MPGIRGGSNARGDQKERETWLWQAGGDLKSALLAIAGGKSSRYTWE